MYWSTRCINIRWTVCLVVVVVCCCWLLLLLLLLCCCCCCCCCCVLLFLQNDFCWWWLSSTMKYLDIWLSYSYIYILWTLVSWNTLSSLLFLFFFTKHNFFKLLFLISTIKIYLYDCVQILHIYETCSWILFVFSSFLFFFFLLFFSCTTEQII